MNKARRKGKAGSQCGDAPNGGELFFREAEKVVLLDSLLAQERAENDDELRVPIVVFRVDLRSACRASSLEGPTCRPAR